VVCDLPAYHRKVGPLACTETVFCTCAFYTARLGNREKSVLANPQSDIPWYLEDIKAYLIFITDVVNATFA
jgi:hypothetical protein